MAAAPAARAAPFLRWRQPCELGQVRATADAVLQFLREQGVAESDARDLELVLVEGCNNAVEYTAPAQRASAIVVDCLLEGEVVELRIGDHTAGFNWPARTALPAPESEGGRGLYLMTQLMDEASYLRSDSGNTLLLRRKLRGPRSAPPAAPEERDAALSGLVEELSSCYESLAAIFRHSRARAGEGELREFARNLLADLQQITGAEWFVLRLKAWQAQRLETFACSGPEPRAAVLELRREADARSGVELLAVSANRDAWFDPDTANASGDPLLADHHGSVGLVHPIYAGDVLVGTLALGRAAAALVKQQTTVPFTAGHLNVVATFTEFLATQVLNARRQEERLAARLVEHELALASNIQRALLPAELPGVAGLELAAACRSAHQVGGDFFDVIAARPDELLVVIADVMGKGVPAAMFAAILRTLVRASPEFAQQPGTLLTRINQVLFNELSNVDMFITAQLVAYHAGTHRLAVASAGHCPLLVAAAGPAGLRQIAPTGMPLGVEPDTRYGEQTLELPAGACALGFTDGVTEAGNAQGERFGSERLEAWLQRSSGRSSTALGLKHSLVATLEEFQGNHALRDDQTFVILNRTQA